MNYSIVEENGLFKVYEHPTEQVIESFKSKNEAKKLMKHLNLGGGFDSWTPSFFVKK